VWWIWKNASTSSKIKKLHENLNIEENEKQLSNVSKVIYNEFEKHDPGKRIQIWQYPPNQIDEVRKAYIKWDSYQMHMTKDNFYFFLYIYIYYCWW